MRAVRGVYVAVSPDAKPPRVLDELTLVTTLIHAKLAESSSPLPCSQIASLITAQHATLASDRNGMGSFRKFVESLSLAPMLVDWTRSGGYLYDPKRHSLVAERAAKPNGQGATAADWDQDRDILPIAAQIHEVTGVPLLAPTSFRKLLRIIESDLAAFAFDLSETGKRVRDTTREHNQPVSRSDVNWVLRGLLLQGHAFGASADDAPTLARETVENVRSLCLREQMVIDPAIDDALERWISRFE